MNDRHPSEQPLARLLVFETQDDEFGIPLGSLAEVIPYRSPTPLPGAPPVLDGIIMVRGRIIYLFNTRRSLGLEDKPVACFGNITACVPDTDSVGSFSFTECN